MCEYRKECFHCLSNNVCLSMAQYDSIYCMMIREFDYKRNKKRKKVNVKGK